MNKALENDLDKAKKELNELQGDLPRFHALLTENERDVQRLRTDKASLRTDKASLDAQAQARGHVQIAREMLEQHQADIQSAQAEVARLEALKQREQKLAQMAKAAAAAKAHREAMDKAFRDATETMYRTTELLLREWRAESEARQAFAQVGTELVPGFSSISNPPWAGLPHEQVEPFRHAVNTLMNDLKARDAALDFASDGSTGRHHCLDEYAKRELPRDELSLLLWQAFLLIAGPEGKQFARFVPKPRQFISLH